MAREIIFFANFQLDLVTNETEKEVEEVSRNDFGELRIELEFKSNKQEFSHTIRIPFASFSHTK